ncbi:patatin-like phospholipase family protein [Corallococcus sp. Z5C101001]|uniref:patatin-like phospholipase family protein n=1 Tax=Corallococcus sp. Z5C101001 TaxID=2596829 RepID=UPI00117E4CFA|nr:patatin-like phospholipase family protein [Corallococcus sp. Z5C101001]TSC31336.1 patatin-like phospholipase family protein [Corallococcus sp. Z5C101001]
MSQDTPLPAPEQHGPLGPLALALSGGGYRAAAFHLGTLRLLDTVGLLPDVVGLSTVSGGTLLGLAWVVSQIDGTPFKTFHEAYSAYLKRTNVIAEALTGLTSDREHGSHAWASLIRSAADVYARPDFLGDRRFGEVLGASGLPLQEAIFNSTEFHTGLDFRFRRSGNPNTILGNNGYRLPRAVAPHIRLADIAAASSCFPGGFEPLVFPQQFHWPEGFPLEAAREALGPKFQDGLPLMDGGIYDNQGIDSLLLAYDRAESPPTLLISDVSTQDPQMYNVPENPTKRGWVTLNGVSWLAWGLLLLALASAAILAWRGFDAVSSGTWAPRDYLLYLVPGVLTAAVATALFWVRARLDDATALLKKQMNLDVWPSFKKLTVPEFSQMLVLRASSLMALTSKVFMKRVRGLVFGRLYQDPRFKNQRVSNLISALTVDRPNLFSRHPWIKPEARLVAQATQACQMPTTLWFTADAQFTTVESTGAATACFVLLRHLLDHHAGQFESPGRPLHELYVRLRQEWAAFNPSNPLPGEPQRSMAA